jgi:rhamnose utilization protein RhaD (predicted bifunctional aldolase and dehydrogenase)
MTKREWQIEMANRFAKRDNDIELEAKLECYERLVDSINMASNPMSEKGREALRNVREMKTIMTKEEEIRKAVEAEREACAKVCDDYDVAEDVNSCDTAEGIAAAIRARGQA